MPKEQHRYKPNTTFDQVMMLYRFDKKLRLLIFNEIEKIENHGSPSLPCHATYASTLLASGSSRIPSVRCYLIVCRGARLFCPQMHSASILTFASSSIS